MMSSKYCAQSQSPCMYVQSICHLEEGPLAARQCRECKMSQNSRCVSYVLRSCHQGCLLLWRGNRLNVSQPGALDKWIKSPKGGLAGLPSDPSCLACRGCHAWLCRLRTAGLPQAALQTALRNSTSQVGKSFPSTLCSSLGLVEQRGVHIPRGSQSVTKVGQRGPTTLYRPPEYGLAQLPFCHQALQDKGPFPFFWILWFIKLPFRKLHV